MRRANDTYFSDREREPRPRIDLELTSLAWGGIAALITSRITNGAFGVDYPLECPDGKAVIGTNERLMGFAVQGDIPEIDWPLRIEEVPATLVALDLVEFCFVHVADPKHRDYDPFYKHHHLDHYREDGRAPGDPAFWARRISRALPRRTASPHGKRASPAPYRMEQGR